MFSYNMNQVWNTIWTSNKNDFQTCIEKVIYSELQIAAGGLQSNIEPKKLNQRNDTNF